ncbi:MAG: MerR family DNA-binding transcriptional regulator [Proteobacteria bacterium]|nr:MerR family DNA-binding transcriptional regulator [Pseudomonadota bacterium]
MKAFPISALSRKSGVTIETIRYYERVGLLPKPSRTTGNYRLYEDKCEWHDRDHGHGSCHRFVASVSG